MDNARAATSTHNEQRIDGGAFVIKRLQGNFFLLLVLARLFAVVKAAERRHLIEIN
jgi:hypothetical protein